MFVKTRNTVTAVPRHIIKHRAKYTCVATTVVVSGVWMNMQSDMVTFLTDRGLWDEFCELSLTN